MSVFQFNNLPEHCEEHYEVHYDDTGEGTPVLFMHGLAANRSQAHCVLARLAQNIKFRLITVDMPGHGESELPATDGNEASVGFEFYSQVGFALLKHLNVNCAILGGISMGAGIAQAMAVSRPKSALGLFLVRPAWLADPARPNLDIIDRFSDLLASETPDNAFDKVAQCADFNTLFSGIPAAAESALQTAHQPGIIKNPWLLRTMIDDQPIARIEVLTRISCPTLVAGNNADPLHPPQLSRAISNAIPCATYEHLPPRYLEPDAHSSAIEGHFKDFLLQRVEPISGSKIEAHNDY